MNVWGHPDFLDMQMGIKCILLWKKTAACVRFCLVKHMAFIQTQFCKDHVDVFLFISFVFYFVGLDLGKFLCSQLLFWFWLSQNSDLRHVICFDYTLFFAPSLWFYSTLLSFCCLINEFSQECLLGYSELHEMNRILSSWHSKTYLGLFRR